MKCFRLKWHDISHDQHYTHGIASHALHCISDGALTARQLDDVSLKGSTFEGALFDGAIIIDSTLDGVQMRGGGCASCAERRVGEAASRGRGEKRPS